MLLGPEGIHSIQPLPPVQLDARQVYVHAPLARQLGLSDGQIVQAAVSAQAGQLHLDIKGQIFQMPLSPYIKDGDMAQLRAHMLANGDWSLQLLHTGSFAGSDMAQTVEKMLRPSRWRTLLFQPEGFASWRQLLEPGALASLAPPESAQAFQQMWRQQRLQMASLQPQQLKRLLLPQLQTPEARLAQGASVAVDEPRALLRWLIAAREQAGLQDTEATHGLHQALDEVESAQVKASQDWQRGELNLSLVVPFADSEPVVFQFEREAERPDMPKPPLIINMHTEGPSLGEVWLRTTISTTQPERRQIDLTMWAVRTDVAAQAMRHAQALTDEIEGAGLVMGGFQVFNGPRPDRKAAQEPPPHGVLIDTRA